MQDLQPDNQGQGVGLPSDQPVDKEGAMAKADLYKLANYSFKLFKKIQDEDQMEAWVQAKITKAADYIASVYHYLEYEMEFSEYGKKIDNSEMYNESQKAQLKAKLNEAKEMVKKLKVEQAEKLSKKEQKVAEGIFGGEEQPCEACGGTGHVMTPERQVPETVKAKVAAYNRKAKAMHAASKRIDRNKNGIPDDEEMEEGQEELKKVGDTYKTKRGGTVTKTATGVRHEKGDYSDEEHAEPAQSKASKASKSAAEKKADKEKEIKLPKPAKGTRGVTEGWKDVVGGAALGAAVLGGIAITPHAYVNGQQIQMAITDNIPNNAKLVTDDSGQKIYVWRSHPVKRSPGNVNGRLLYRPAEDVKEGAIKDIEASQRNTSLRHEVIGSRRKAAGLDEAAPSAGMTKKEKSAVVKKAKSGGDIGKPGKGFEKVEKAAKAGGAKDPKAVAAAAMWKTAKKKAVKESTEEVIPQVEPSQEDPAMSEANMTDAQFKAALEKVRAENPQALAAALNSSDPNALNKLLGFKLSPGEKLQPAISPDDQGTLGKPGKVAAPLRENADLDAIKMLSGLK